MAAFKIELSEAKKFAAIWTANGVAVPLSDTAIQFATDFSNVVLSNFIQMCQQRAAEDAKNTKTISKQIIMEGVR